jgi:carbonic anhydrase
MQAKKFPRGIAAGLSLVMRHVLPVRHPRGIPSGMSVLNDILAHNARFVEQREYEPFLTDRFPDKRLVVLTCMDTRLVELLPRAMNIRNGDAHVIKNAGAIVSHPFGSVMRSLLVSVYELQSNEVAVVGHYG